MVSRHPPRAIERARIRQGFWLASDRWWLSDVLLAGVLKHPVGMSCAAFAPARGASARMRGGDGWVGEGGTGVDVSSCNGPRTC